MGNTHDGDQPEEHWVAMYVDEIGDYFDPYVQNPQHIEFMNEHCSQWSPNDHILQSPISTVCSQYWVAFLMFRCRNISMHAFALLFTSDLIANDCCVFDWLGALNKNDVKHVLVSYVNDVNNVYLYTFHHNFPDIQMPILGRNTGHIDRLITESIQ